MPALREWLIANRPLILFVYGQVFLVMGIAIVGLPGRPQGIQLGQAARKGQQKDRAQRGKTPHALSAAVRSERQRRREHCTVFASKDVARSPSASPAHCAGHEEACAA